MILLKKFHLFLIHKFDYLLLHVRNRLNHYLFRFNTLFRLVEATTTVDSVVACISLSNTAIVVTAGNSCTYGICRYFIYQNMFLDNYLGYDRGCRISRKLFLWRRNISNRKVTYHGILEISNNPLCCFWVSPRMRFDGFGWFMRISCSMRWRFYFIQR